MSKKSSIKTEAKAVARVEASAKASFKRKKNVTEVIPPDVIRAKASAWLDLISPITEWAGLKGDALKFERQQLRIQQEESLLLIAHSVRRKIAGREAGNPVPRKILVPALEKASLEDAADEAMIELWANLLASAYMGQKVEPRYIGIIEELSTSQAKCLSSLVRHRSEEMTAPFSAFYYARYEVSERDVRAEIDDLIRPYLGADDLNIKQKRHLDSKLREWATNFSGPGFYLEGFSLGEVEHNLMIGEGLNLEEKDLDILESLGLIRRLNVHFKYENAPASYKWGFAMYLYLTGLGVDFVSVCEPELVSQFKAREDELKGKIKPG